MKILYKYNIAVREKPNTGKTWVLYKNCDLSEEPIYTDHVETEVGVPVYTNEKAGGLGFGMIAEGVITKKLNTVTGRPYILIKKGE